MSRFWRLVAPRLRPLPVAPSGPGFTEARGGHRDAGPLRELRLDQQVSDTVQRLPEELEAVSTGWEHLGTSWSSGLTMFEMLHQWYWHGDDESIRLEREEPKACVQSLPAGHWLDYHETVGGVNQDITNIAIIYFSGLCFVLANICYRDSNCQLPC